jgi:hypothetical protein
MGKGGTAGSSKTRAGGKDVSDGKTDVARRAEGWRVTRHQVTVSKPGVTNAEAGQSGLPTTTTMEGVMPRGNRRLNRTQLIEGHGIP